MVFFKFGNFPTIISSFFCPPRVCSSKIPITRTLDSLMQSYLITGSFFSVNVFSLFLDFWIVYCSSFNSLTIYSALSRLLLILSSLFFIFEFVTNTRIFHFQKFWKYIASIFLHMCEQMEPDLHNGSFNAHFILIPSSLLLLHLLLLLIFLTFPPLLDIVIFTLFSEEFCWIPKNAEYFPVRQLWTKRPYFGVTLYLGIACPCCWCMTPLGLCGAPRLLNGVFSG